MIKFKCFQGGAYNEDGEYFLIGTNELLNDFFEKNNVEYIDCKILSDDSVLLVYNELEEKPKELTDKEIIDNYLESKDIGYRVCAKELIFDVLGRKNDSRRDSIFITELMREHSEWILKNPTKLPKYGNQRYWVKTEKGE